eukprot:365324-Chlamydomonas_euryale.AAC.5
MPVRRLGLRTGLHLQQPSDASNMAARGGRHQSGDAILVDRHKLRRWLVVEQLMHNVCVARGRSVHQRVPSPCVARLDLYRWLVVQQVPHALQVVIGRCAHERGASARCHGRAELRRWVVHEQLQHTSHVALVRSRHDCGVAAAEGKSAQRARPRPCWQADGPWHGAGGPGSEGRRHTTRKWGRAMQQRNAAEVCKRASPVALV